MDWRDTASGLVGSIACVLSGAPFDLVKARAQVGVASSGLVSSFRTVVSEEGLLALWRGSLPAVASAMIENGVLFTANGALKRLWAESFEKNVDALDTLDELAVGSLSGLFSSTAICVPEVIKVRLQVAGAAALASGGVPRFSGPIDCLTKTLREEGPSALFKGLFALQCRDVPFCGIFFASYAGYTQLLELLPLPWRDATNPALTPPEVVLAGGLAGSTSWAVVFPADIVKSRLQVHEGKGLGVMEVTRTLYRSGGVRAFYSGVSAAVLRAFPANGMLFVGVEMSRKLFDKL